MSSEQRANGFPLDSDTPSVDQAHLPEAHLDRRFQVGLDDPTNVTRPEGVEIDEILDRNDDLFGIGIGLVAASGHGRPISTVRPSAGMTTTHPPAA